MNFNPKDKCYSQAIHEVASWVLEKMKSSKEKRVEIYLLKEKIDS